MWGERRESAAKRARRAYSKMAANGSVDEQSAAGELDDNSDKIVLNNVNTPLIECVCDTFDAKDTVDDQRHPDELASRLAATGASWITTNHNKSKMIASSAAPLTFCSQDDPRRTLRIDRSGSTERFVFVTHLFSFSLTPFVLCERNLLTFVLLTARGSQCLFLPLSPFGEKKSQRHPLVISLYYVIQIKI